MPDVTRLQAYAFLSATLTAVLTCAVFMSTGITGKADIFYVHYLGFRWFEPAMAHDIVMRYAAAVPEQAYEVARREMSAGNYPVIAIASYLMTQIFPGSLTAAIIAAQALAFAIGLAIAGSGFWLGHRDLPAMALALAPMALLALPVGPMPSDHLLAYASPALNLLNGAALVVAPGEAFSALSFWPKSSLTLIMLAALTVRWAGRYRESYALLLATMLFHITLGGLLFLAFVLMDILLRPRQLPWRTLAGFGVIALLAFTFGQWRAFADTGQLWILIAAVIASGPIAFYASRHLAPVAAAFPVWLCDTVAVVAATILAVPLLIALYLLSPHADMWGPQSAYVQIGARMMVLATAVIFLALGKAGMLWLERRNVERAILPVLVVVPCIMAYAAIGAWWWHGRDLGKRMDGLTQRQETEPLTAVYYRALLDLSLPARKP